MSHNEEVCDLMASKTSDSEYRQLMDCPMEDLTFEMWGSESNPIHDRYKDHQIVEIAARKIKLLRSMLLACGVKESMLKAIMDDA